MAATMERLTVADIMQTDVVTVKPNTTVARLLTNAGVHRALVLENGRLVGIVSATDLVRMMAEDASGAER